MDMADTKTNVTLGFRTCFTMEAVEEINLMLKNAGYSERISEDDLIGTYECDKKSGDESEDDFDDVYFEFAATLPGSYEDIKEKLGGTGVDVGLMDNEAGNPAD